MSVKNATKQIQTWIEELEEITGVVEVDQVKVAPGFDPTKPVGPDNEPYVANPDYDPSKPIEQNPDTGEVTNLPYQTEKVPINGAFSCERLQEIVDEYVKQITDAILAHAQSIANIISDWAPLLSLPTDPLKILKWASKVVGGPIGTQIALIVELVIDIAQLVGAIAQLVSAVASAIAKLIACLEQQIFDAFNAVLTSVLQNAANLVATAESLVDTIVANALEATGAQDLIDQVELIGDDLGTAKDEVITAISDAEKARSDIDKLGRVEDQLKTSIARDSLSLETRIEKGLVGIDGTAIVPGANT